MLQADLRHCVLQVVPLAQLVRPNLVTCKNNDACALQASKFSHGYITSATICEFGILAVLELGLENENA